MVAESAAAIAIYSHRSCHLGPPSTAETSLAMATSTWKTIETQRRQDPEKVIATAVACGTNDDGVLTDKLKAVQWHPGFMARFPLLGASAMFTMLCCIASVGIVLGTSHDKFRNEWPVDERWKWAEKYGHWVHKAQIEPHVLLAIVNTISNVALAIAIGQGVAIAWWRRAMQGSTIMVCMSAIPLAAAPSHHRNK